MLQAFGYLGMAEEMLAFAEEDTMAGGSPCFNLELGT